MKCTWYKLRKGEEMKHILGILVKSGTARAECQWGASPTPPSDCGKMVGSSNPEALFSQFRLNCTASFKFFFLVAPETLLGRVMKLDMHIFLRPIQDLSLRNSFVLT